VTIRAAGSIAIYDIDPYLCDSYVIRTRDLKYQDPQDPPHMRSTLSDYRGSGFDRGHMVAAGGKCVCVRVCVCVVP